MFVFIGIHRNAYSVDIYFNIYPLSIVCRHKKCSSDQTNGLCKQFGMHARQFGYFTVTPISKLQSPQFETKMKFYKIHRFRLNIPILKTQKQCILSLILLESGSKLILSIACTEMRVQFESIERKVLLIKCKSTMKFMVGFFSPKFGFQVTQ